MGEEFHSIFRKEALESWMNHEESTAVPGLISPRLFVFYWILIGLLMALGVWLSCAEVKTYTSGKGIIVHFEETVKDEQEKKPHVVLFFPADIHANLKVGKIIMIRYGHEQIWHRQVITGVEPEVFSPEEVSEKFGFVAHRPVAVALSRPDDQEEHGLSQEISRDNTLEVRIESGSRTIASFLPMLGGFLKNSN